MSPFQMYLFGYLIFVIGLSVAAYLLGAPPVWIAVGVIILIGIGIMAATTRSRP